MTSAFSTSPNFICCFELLKLACKTKNKSSLCSQSFFPGLYLFLFREHGPMFPKSNLLKVWSHNQGLNQAHSPGWVIVPLYSFGPQILIKFSYFSLKLLSFSSSSPLPSLWVGYSSTRSWLWHCLQCTLLKPYSPQSNLL